MEAPTESNVQQYCYMVLYRCRKCHQVIKQPIMTTINAIEYLENIEHDRTIIHQCSNNKFYGICDIIGIRVASYSEMPNEALNSDNKI